jgi:hypothetical protein
VSSYLFAWLVFLGLALGGMANLMLHNLTGGTWGLPLRPLFAGATRLVPIAALLGLPVLFGMHALYPIGESAWFGAAFFAARSVFYLALWSVLALLVLTSERPQALSAIGLIVYGFSMSLAAVDWIGSLVPQWYSAGFGLVVAVGQMLGAMALAIAYLGLRTPALPRALFHDLGNLLLMYVLTWAYVAFMQFLIIWTANLPREIAWYVPRLQTGWVALGVILVVFHFFVPLAILLSRTAKRSPMLLGWLAAAVFAVHAIDVYWLVAPSVRPTGFHVAWLDPVALAVLSALWWFTWRPAHA